MSQVTKCFSKWNDDTVVIKKHLQSSCYIKAVGVVINLPKTFGEVGEHDNAYNCEAMAVMHLQITSIYFD